MITIKGKCNMCGRLEPSIEVEIPHATNEHRKAAGIGPVSVMCAAICRTCVRAAVMAWSQPGKAEWARMKAERAELAEAVVDE